MDNQYVNSGQLLYSARLDEHEKINPLSRSIKSEYVASSEPLRELYRDNPYAKHSQMNMNNYEDPVYRKYKNNMPKANYSNNNNTQLKRENEVNIMETSLNVKLKSEEKDDWMRELKVTMSISFSSPSKQMISISITDPCDPLLLYNLDIGEQEFHFLKQDQSLIIEFQHFPQVFFEMLEMCKGDKDNDRDVNILNKSQYPSSYLCIFHKRNLNDALLIIQERTQFKEVNHLILTFKPASDAFLKKYLSSVCKEFKSRYESAFQENLKLSNNLENSYKENAALKEELSGMKSLHGNEIENMNIARQKEINSIRESLFEENKAKQEQKENEKNEQINDISEKLAEMCSKYDTLLKERISLEEAKLKLEASERELMGKNSTLSSELKVYKDEVFKLRNENSEISQTSFSQGKTLAEFTIKTELLAKQLEEKEKNMMHLTQLLENVNKQKQEYEENLKLTRMTNNKLEEKLQASINEINKGNDIIQKLQGDLKAQKQKAKLRQQSISTQEQLLTQKQLQLDEQVRLAGETKRELDKKDDEIKACKMTIESMKASFEEAKRVMEDNEKMIRYLNKNLNETYNPFRNFLREGEINVGGFKGILNENQNNNNNNNPQLQTEFTYKTNDFASGSSFGKTPNVLFNSDAFGSVNNVNIQTGNQMVLPETNFTNYKSTLQGYDNNIIGLKEKGIPSSANLEGTKYSKIPINTNSKNVTGISTSQNLNNLLSHKYGGTVQSSIQNSNREQVNSDNNVNYYNNNKVVVISPNFNNNNFEEEEPRPSPAINQSDRAICLNNKLSK